MGDVDVETAPALEGEGGRYSAVVHQDWEIWGPCGGYVAAIALRAAGAESPFARPASFFCHYLSVAAFEPVDLVVTPLRSGRTVLAQRVEMTQGGRAVLEAMVWSVGEVAGLEHQDVLPPDVAGPDAVPVRTMGPPPGDEDDDHPDYRFWDNFEQRPLEWIDDWPPPGPLPPTWRTWVRYRETERAGRSLGRRGSPRGRARRRQLASRPSPPHASRAWLHRAQPRSVRVVPGPPRLGGVAPARRSLAGGTGRPALVDRAASGPSGAR